MADQAELNNNSANAKQLDETDSITAAVESNPDNIYDVEAASRVRITLSVNFPETLDKVELASDDNSCSPFREGIRCWRVFCWELLLLTLVAAGLTLVVMVNEKLTVAENALAEVNTTDCNFTSQNDSMIIQDKKLNITNLTTLTPHPQRKHPHQQLDKNDVLDIVREIIISDRNEIGSIFETYLHELSHVVDALKPETQPETTVNRTSKVSDPRPRVPTLSPTISFNHSIEQEILKNLNKTSNEFLKEFNFTITKTFKDASSAFLEAMKEKMPYFISPIGSSESDFNSTTTTPDYPLPTNAIALNGSESFELSNLNSTTTTELIDLDSEEKHLNLSNLQPLIDKAVDRVLQIFNKRFDELVARKFANQSQEIAVTHSKALVTSTGASKTILDNNKFDGVTAKWNLHVEPPFIMELRPANGKFNPVIAAYTANVEESKNNFFHQVVKLFTN